MTTTREMPPLGRDRAGDDLPTCDRSYRRLGWGILLVAFGGFVAWALSASLAVAVVAPGTVSMASFTRTVQHLEGGTVREILVADGDRVEAGQPLVVLNATQPRSQLQIARTQYLLGRAMETRLLAEQRGAALLTFPDELLHSEPERVQDMLAVQQGLFLARRQAFDSTLEALDEQVTQMNEQIEGFEALIRVNESRIRSLSGEADDFRALFREGLGDNQRVRELERQVLQYQGEIAQYRADIARLRSQISESRMQREIHRQELQKEVGEQLRDVQARLAEAEEQIVALSERVARTRVLAPVAGTVVDRRVHSRGAVVQPGGELLDIVPAGDGYIVEVRVANRDIDNIHHGQPASIRFSAFNQRLTRVIAGEVIFVSADSFEDEATGGHYYRVRVRVTEAGQQDMSEQMALLSGMPAEVMIRTGQRTFASYLFKPITDMLARAIREE
ncbi:HlyD family type I secretion periplasmic adaptor subunit [Halomonas sp. 328]|nr:HlyD family type I secretion periplasmic adaptor subunit [Halomonas sp. 328]